MIIFKDFESFNEYVGLKKPIDNDIDIGYYDSINMRSQSEPVQADFYRIGIKINYIDKSLLVPKPITAIFFSSPDMVNGWNVEPNYTGMYVQLSKKIIEENRFLFKTYLDYGQHEALYLTESEVQEISTLFGLMHKYYKSEKQNFKVLLSYTNVLISVIEDFYNRQFSTNPKEYNRIVTDFQQSLNDYYNQPAKQLPNVQYFADELGLTPNYLGDIIKHFTNKSALENIHEFVIKKAKDLLEKDNSMNNAQVAYELGFEYPNYFSKFFKKQVNLTPKEYREQIKNTNL
ncbi:AraC-like DNA-binding protein [Flavobacterium sp. 90]|uniref:helix-turn-helix domain-containing protein n=1 Tax=unclassified Flavobacterium TaxID=196869 RepID=UPI000EABBCD3|nr:MULTISPECIES: helix-turn-helix domain-containing protein [unclassified Flavobacterium]RKR05317.1 AraC-like DNA-binding protein [Flavobacterium sp. 81]TCK56631.1 AraC-like DNA-binding protein [Flavobacterium sp. 90]